MSSSCQYLPYHDTGFFSKLVTDYINQNADLKPFYKFSPDKDGIAQAIKEREKYPVDRKVLVDTLLNQYRNLPEYDKVKENISLLANDNTFTVCTAHQPNLLTGYLYFIYKIIHAIKLAEELNEEYPDKNFVPVYYMGSEDNDLDELGTFRFNGDKYVWDGGGQTGAVGRMNTQSLKPLLHNVFRLFGPPGENCNELIDILNKAYLEHGTIAEGTQYLVNELFGRYGLVVLNPDEPSFKKSIIPMMHEDLLQHKAHTIVSQQIEKLSAHYKSQAYPRPINLFYLTDDLRERIEKKDDHWEVVNTNIRWNEEELLKELNAHPERFSPNVILRGVFQETILPDVAFIGGGSEVAYWMQLKTVFEHYNIFYPTVLLRQSVMWVKPAISKLQSQLELSLKEVFLPEKELVKSYVAAHSANDWQTKKEASTIENIFSSLQQKATSLDPTLTASAKASLTKMKYQLQVLEKKMLRAEKRKMQTQLQRINKLKNGLFPKNSLQERVENFANYYLEYGPAFFDTIKDMIQPLASKFLIVIDEN